MRFRGISLFNHLSIVLGVLVILFCSKPASAANYGWVGVYNCNWPVPCAMQVESTQWYAKNGNIVYFNFYQAQKGNQSTGCSTPDPYACDIDGGGKIDVGSLSFVGKHEVCMLCYGDCMPQAIPFNDCYNYTQAEVPDCLPPRSNDSTSIKICPHVIEILEWQCTDCCDGQTDFNCKGCDENGKAISSTAHFISGNLMQSLEIFTSKGAGSTMSLGFSYNSLDTATGPLGIGWTHNYNEKITTSANDTLIFKDGSGKSVYYYNVGPNRYKAAPKRDYTFITKNTDGSYLLEEKGGLVKTFDQNGKLTAITDRNNNTITLTYAGANLTSISDPYNMAATLSYDASNRISSITDFSSKTFTLAYNAGGYLTSATDSTGRQWQYTYNGTGKMSAKTDPKGNTSSYTYDGSGRVISSTDQEGKARHLSYSPATNTTVITELDGGVWTYKYNRVKNVLLELTDPQGGKTTYQYDGNRNKISETDPAGNVTRYTYDANANMTSVQDHMGNTTSYTYNQWGQVLSTTDPRGGVTTFTFDGNGNLTSVSDPLGNSSGITYDSRGRQAATTDAKGNSTSYTYDVTGMLDTITDPLGSMTRYSYYNDDSLAGVTDAKNQTLTYEYDTKGRLTRMTDQLGRSETYVYNTYDNLISVTDRKAQTTTYTYDIMNRMQSVTYGDGSSTTYTYDTVGRLTTINDSVSGMISYTYGGSSCGTGCSGGSQYEVIEEVTPLGRIDYTYDALGRRDSMTVAGQPAVDYTYDANGRLTDIGTLINGAPSTFSLNYDSLGRRTGITYPNDVNTYYAYDNASRLLDLQHVAQPNTLLESLSYGYDANGNMTSMNRPSVLLPLPNAASNITYNDANQMLTFNTENITYDVNGNMTSATSTCGTTTFTWDARNRLVGISSYKPDCSSLSASFVYDALGRRIQKTINGRTMQYLYDGLDIVQEKENGAVTVNYIRTLNIDEPLARIEANGNVRYYHSDALGSIIALTDETGASRTQYVYDSFGNVTISGEASDNPFQYTGRENDNTGLYYYRARYYLPELQRFISEDPIGLKGGINKYVYTSNNPLNYVDALGLKKGCGPFGIALPVYKEIHTCCVDHDDCYDNCGKSKYCCDTKFCDCMARNCSTLPLEKRIRCLKIADDFCGAVKGWGSFAYLPSCGRLW
jgi:RHS repeat-associated protein